MKFRIQSHKERGRSYGTDFEEDDSTSETEVNDGMCILTLASEGNRARTGHWASEKNARSYPVSKLRCTWIHGKIKLSHVLESKD